MPTRVSPLAAALCLAAPAALAAPVTYQGRLDDGGSPANGLYDIRFDLYDDETPGAPDTLVESETVLGVSVTDGVFTADVPFSTFSFDLADRYIELAVRPAGGGAYTTLLPRQQIAEAPLAKYATRASSLDLPVSIGGDPGVPNGVLLSIINNGADGSAIWGTGPTTGVTGRAGNITGSPLITPLPVGLYGLGEGTGVTGSSGSGVGVFGASHMGTAGEFVITHAPNANPALLARTPSTEDDAFAVHGILDVTTAGAGSAAVRGESLATNGFFAGIGVWGSSEGLGHGVYGTSVTGSGVRGFSDSGTGISGQSVEGDAIRGFSTGDDSRAGFFEINNINNVEACVYARTDSTQPNAYGVHGWVEGPTVGSFSAGVRGENGGTGGTGIGVWGSHDGSGTGVYGSTVNGIGVWGQETGSGLAGFFSGNVSVIGNLTKTSGTFKIDHPLDPANKYLSHSFVESPDMKNIYDGVATLDESGRAEVTLPDYFEALNENFRYQLTCLGGYAPVYIEREISANTFVIAGGNPAMRVSWQVTGSRKDAHARANPIIVEEDKPAHERGRYLTPEAHGHPAELGIGYRAPAN